MRGNLNRGPRRTKIVLCRPRQSKHRPRQPISSVMQAVQGLLPTAKAAVHLHILTDVPVSTCEKLLCGQRAESAETLIAFLRSEIGREVLVALMGEARPAWFTRYQRQLDVNAARRQLAETQAMIERLQNEASEA